MDAMKDREIIIKAEPFSWNDNFSELAMEYFAGIRGGLNYCACQSIGMALAKLQMIENGQLKLNNQGEWIDDGQKDS